MSKPRLRVRAWYAAALVAIAAALVPVHATERGPARRSSSAATTSAPTRAQVIVKYKADSSLMRALSDTSAGASSGSAMPLHVQALGLRLGLALTDGRPTGPRAQVVTATGITSTDLAARLAAQGDVEYAVVDERVHVLTVPNDPLFSAGQTTTPATGQWYLRTAGVDGEVASINAEAAWAITTGSSSVVVAVVDTGITAHPDLVGKVLPGYDFITDPATANDGGGRDADPSDTGDGITAAETNNTASQFYGCGALDSNGQATLAEPDSWHGTQTAGLIGAATNNSVGMASVGWNVMILPVRALGKCGGVSSDVSAAIQWAAGITIPGIPVNPNPAKVINLSLGGTSGAACGAAYQDAVSAVIAKGVVVVAAAGNDGLALGSPANCTGVISVAGVRHAGTKVGYSDLGSGVTIAAPAGNCVNTTGTCLFPLLTTSNDGTFALGNPVYTDGDVRESLGTSFSAPLVAGTVALMFSANPGLTPAQVKAALTSTARAFPSTGSPPIQLDPANNSPFVAVAACQAPTSTAQEYECYCTTSTCGAGLLDAGAAVAAVGIVPNVTVTASASSVTAGGSVTFSGAAVSGTVATPVQTYLWTITSGSAIASFSSATNAADATVVSSGAGTFTVSLTVTDVNGKTGTGVATVTVAAAAVTTPVTSPVTGSSTSSSSGGGGSLSLGWLLGLLMAVIALFLVAPPRPRR